MAVFTKLTKDEIETYLKDYSIGKLLSWYFPDKTPNARGEWAWIFIPAAKQNSVILTSNVGLRIL